MNKRLLVGMLSAFMAMAPWCGHAAQTVDAPHRTVDSTNLATEDDCTSCHFTNFDVSLPEGACERCHKANTAPYGDTIAPSVGTNTHKNLKCQACHNPHVSLQAAGILGTFADVTYDAVSGTSTLTGVSPTPEASWAAKTTDDLGAPKLERGLILWVADGAENESYEIKSVCIAVDDPLGCTAANTVTVKGNVTTSARDFDLRRGQLIAKKVTKTVGASYKQGDLPAGASTVQFPSPAGSPYIYVDTQNGSSPTGICQVCHTALGGTTHWTSDGGNTNHNNPNPDGKVCTDCHKHSSGFLVTACNGCHEGTGADGVPVNTAGMAKPPTGSATPGQHQIHAVDYAMPCTTCHTGTGMDRVNDPTNPVADAKIQIGFSTTKYPLGYMTSYDGQTGVVYGETNKTNVSNGGSMTCSAVYCHSNGSSIRLNCTTSVANTSPKWDGSTVDGDATKCNNCHGFTGSYGNPMTSARHTGPHSGYACHYCHADTVDTNLTIPANKRANHADGVYTVKAGHVPGNPAVPMTFTYDPTAKTCSSGGCHMGYSTAWTNGYTDTTNTCIPQATLCATGDAGNTINNVDPVIVPWSVPIANTDAWVYANDLNTLHYKIRGYDPDSIDAVVAQCGAGGHAGANTFTRTVIGGGQCTNFTSLAASNTPYKEIELICRFPDALLASTSNNMCVNYAQADNHPGTYNLLASYNWIVPNNMPYDGLAKAGIKCLNPVTSPEYIIDMPMNNVLPAVSKVISATGKTISITFTASDPDQDNTEKNAYYKGLNAAKTGGHLATTPHFVEINWSNEGLMQEVVTPGTTNALQLTATGGSKTYSFNYLPVAGETQFDARIGTNDGAAATQRYGNQTKGTQATQAGAWFNAFVCDNHYLGYEQSKIKHCYNTGWTYQLFN